MTLRTQIETASSGLTQSERKLATALLSGHPFGALISIQELAAPHAGDQSPVNVHATSQRIEDGYLEGFLRRATPQMKSAGEAVTEGNSTVFANGLPILSVASLPFVDGPAT